MSTGQWVWLVIIVFLLVVLPVAEHVFGHHSEPEYRPDPYRDQRPTYTPHGQGPAWEDCAPYPECFEEDEEDDDL